MEKTAANFLSKVLYWIVIVGIVVMTVTIIGLPKVVDFIFKGSAFYATVSKRAIYGLLYTTSIPAWIILWLTKRLAKNIIMRDPFSRSSVQSLKGISICALVIFFCYLFTCIWVQATFGIIVITVGAFIVALIAAILYQLVELAINIKEENDLTI